ncbi:DUF397 domain-containing protein [Streptomyces albus subsp. chlorinus]|uniref:DUF397 domain-containing protein n=1 Tax=Streptomyces albus TaxID=1888 RepID=UPI00156E8FB1|nr:DUF397 domain-containing protein [Streptomyces albus]NSC22158.1 DUF397 domain-containing protein [Streptomyces albus subsp. chlorinus]
MNPTSDLAGAVWRKSSHSNGDGGNCVEVAENYPGLMPVRDSKQPAGPAIVFSRTSWSAFVDAVKSQQLR